jgi:predicted methyltransferase
MRETPLEDAIADVAVFCLSISWGTDDDRIQYFKEAHRILKRKGFLYLAEPSDKYDDRDRTELLKTLESCGFVKVGDIDDRGKFFHLTAVKI